MPDLIGHLVAIQARKVGIEASRGTHPDMLTEISPSGERDMDRGASYAECQVVTENRLRIFTQPILLKAL